MHDAQWWSVDYVRRLGCCTSPRLQLTSTAGGLLGRASQSVYVVQARDSASEVTSHLFATRSDDRKSFPKWGTVICYSNWPSLADLVVLCETSQNDQAGCRFASEGRGVLFVARSDEATSSPELVNVGDAVLLASLF